MEHIPGVLRVYDPAPDYAVPLLADSPHSGDVYPKDFGYACEKAALQRYEDRRVDWLIENFVHLGATVVCADVPRTYLDLNRAATDLRSEHIRGGWTGALKPKYAHRGVGLVWTHAGGEEIYDHFPTAEDIRRRISTYYQPYYATLKKCAAKLQGTFGKFWHLNIHSMPHVKGRADIILGDLNGKSCSDGFRECLAAAFRDCGLGVAENIDYQGARLTELFGKPQGRSESIQIEINKRLYLKDDLLAIDEKAFASLQAALEQVCKIAGNYAAAEAASLKTSSNAASRARSMSSMDTRLPSELSEVTP